MKGAPSRTVGPIAPSRRWKVGPKNVCMAAIAAALVCATAAFANPAASRRISPESLLRFVPGSALNQALPLYRFRSVGQHEAEALFIGSTAAVYFADSEEVWILSSDGFDATRRWRAFGQRQHLQEMTLDSQSEEQLLGQAEPLGVVSMADFAALVASALNANASGHAARYRLMLPAVVEGPPSLEALDEEPGGLSAQATQAVALYEGFESSPWSRWQRSDNSGGSYTWTQSSCSSNSGNYSADSFRGGVSGQLVGCYDDFPANINNWIKDGTCENIQGAAEAWLDFYLSYDINSQGASDKFFVGFPNSTGSYTGWSFSGYSYGYEHNVFDLKHFSYLGDLTTKACNKIAFGFTSDASYQNGWGTRLDDITIRTGTPFGLACSASVTPPSGSAPLAVNLTGQASGYSANPTYAWRVDGTKVASTPNASYTFTSAGTFVVDFTVDAGSSGWCASTVMVTVTAPECSLSCSAVVPASGSVGQSLSFLGSSTVSSCSGQPTYDWNFGDGSPHSSTQSPQHLYSTAGNYTWTLTVSAGGKTCVKSGTISIAAACVPPSITSQPSPQTVVKGQSATVSVAATGTGPLSYQWFVTNGPADGVAIGGATAATFTTPALSATTSYFVQVRNACGTVQSNAVTITVTEGGAFTYIVPAVAHWPGANGTQWRTDLSIVNATAVQANVTLDYVSRNDSMTANISQVLSPGQTLSWKDVLSGALGLAPTGQNVGTIRLSSTAPLAAIARTYNMTAQGTFGQAYPAVAVNRAIASGQVAVLPHLSNNTTYRSNVGIVNLGASAVAVLIKLYSAAGTQLGNSVTINADAGRYQQVDNIFGAAGAGQQDLAYATAEVITQGGKAWAFAAVVDNTSGDPTTIEMIVP